MTRSPGILIISLFSFISVLLTAHPSFADEVITDDLIVQGRMCVGFDCVNNEAFSNDVLLKLKENNLRILFQDTSSSSSFPTNDWQIVINDSVDGGQSYFAIEDVDGGVIPFKIKAGAPGNSLYVDKSGRVGLGTNKPKARLHVEGDAYISGNLELGSSRAYKENIRSLEIAEAREAIKCLRPVRFHYKNDPSEETLGFIAEELPDLVATNSRKSFNPVNVIAVLTKVMQEQQELIDNLSRRMDVLEKDIYQTTE